jgi:hypothetical protein
VPPPHPSASIVEFFNNIGRKPKFGQRQDHARPRPVTTDGPRQALGDHIGSSTIPDPERVGGKRRAISLLVGF